MADGQGVSDFSAHCISAELVTCGCNLMVLLKAWWFRNGHSCWWDRYLNLALSQPRNQKVFQSSLLCTQRGNCQPGGQRLSLFSLPFCQRPVGGASRPRPCIIMRGGVYAWTLQPRLNRLEKKWKRKNLPQGKVTSVFLTFLLAGVLYKKRRADSPEYFLFF